MASRINVVPVNELCDQHLVAEHKCIAAIPKSVLAGSLYLQCDRPYEYVVCGEGHLKFFTDKLQYLYTRYNELDDEATKRGLKVAPFDWPKQFLNRTTLHYWNPYRPTRSALFQNRKHLKDNAPIKAKHSAYV